MATECETVRTECRSEFDAIHASTDRIGRKVDEMHQIMLGNGEPEKGVVARLIRIDERLKAGRDSTSRFNAYVGTAIAAAAVSVAILIAILK